MKLPMRVRVKELVKSRYQTIEKPKNWDERVAGCDMIRTEEGLSLNLLSDGGQNPPKPGWELMLLSGDSEAGYAWTLYGM